MSRTALESLGPELALPLRAPESDHGNPRPTSGHCWPWLQVSPWVWSLFLYGFPFLGPTEAARKGCGGMTCQALEAAESREEQETNRRVLDVTDPLPRTSVCDYLLCVKESTLP